MRLATFQACTLCVVASTLTGCSLLDSGTEWKSGQFEVLWVDLTSNSHLAYRLSETTSIGIVESCVFEAGSNSEYVVVKQKPDGLSKVNFYVVPIDKYAPEKDPSNVVIGPLSESEYRSLGERTPMPVLTTVFPESVCDEKV